MFACLFLIIIIIIIIIVIIVIIIPCKFFLPVLIDGFSLKSVRQKISCFKDSS